MSGTSTRGGERPNGRVSIAALPQTVETVQIVAMLTPSHAVDQFLSDLDRKSRSRKGRTVGEYRRILYKFADSLGNQTDVTEITSEHVRAFFRGYTHLAPNTMATYDSIVRSFFDWLDTAGRIRRDPMREIPKSRRVDPMDLDVVTVDRGDVPRLLDAAETWPEILAVHLGLYTGGRRSALSSLRLRHYNQATGKLKFYEKGGKAIEKAVPDELRELLDAAIAMGLYRTPDDYLIPSEGKTLRAERDDRVIWRVVKRVAKRAGVPAHVHALRAAYATFYLEGHPGNIVGLQDLMGHSSSEVTKVYLRKRDRQAQMETVRDLSWRSVAPSEYGSLSNLPQIAEKSLASSLAVGAGGFEPPSGDNPHGERAGRLPRASEGP